jgi:SAM-dependent methyltransferase
MDTTWNLSLQLSIDTRAGAVSKRPSVAELCFVAGREPRLWSDEARYIDMIDSIVEQCEIGETSSVLEVGCAGGFIARGIGPRVRAYYGIDFAPRAIDVARRLGVRNARYSVADGAQLRFSANSFDAAFCYDVFTNFPEFADGVALIREMLRVVRPCGTVLVGSIPDRATRVGYEAKVAEVLQKLDEQYGPVPPSPVDEQSGWRQRLGWLLRRRRATAIPQVSNYYFERADFERFGAELGVTTELVDIHRRNPYRGYRFNVIYRKPA